MRIVLPGVCLLASALLQPSSAAAVPEANLVSEMQTLGRPYFDAARKGFLTGADDVPLAFWTFERDDEKGALVYLTGRNSSPIRNIELFYDLRHSGWSIYTFDHRGQGFSGRMLENRNKGHVEDFDFYADDLKRFLDEVVNVRKHERVVIMSHSMGGAVATWFALRYPGEADALILHAPMHEPNYGQYSENMASALAVYGMTTGQRDEYAIGQGDPELPYEFNDNGGSQSRARFDFDQSILAEHPEIFLGGVTYGWAYQVLKTTRIMRNEAWRLDLPILLLQAGKDATVKNRSQDTICSRAKDCRRVIFPDAAHNVLTEIDATRDRAMSEITGFLDKLAGGHEPVPAGGCSAATPIVPLVVVGSALFALAGRRRHARHGKAGTGGLSGRSARA